MPDGAPIPAAQRDGSWREPYERRTLDPQMQWLLKRLDAIPYERESPGLTDDALAHDALADDGGAVIDASLASTSAKSC